MWTARGNTTCSRVARNNCFAARLKGLLAVAQPNCLSPTWITAFPKPTFTNCSPISDHWKVHQYIMIDLDGLSVSIHFLWFTSFSHLHHSNFRFFSASQINRYGWCCIRKTCRCREGDETIQWRSTRRTTDEHSIGHLGSASPKADGSKYPTGGAATKKRSSPAKRLDPSDRRHRFTVINWFVAPFRTTTESGRQSSDQKTGIGRRSRQRARRLRKRHETLNIVKQ